MRVNIGCGATPTDGWVNFDNSPSVLMSRWPFLVWALSTARVMGEESCNLARVASHKNIRFANASKRIPLATGSVDAVYSSHMIEHLDRRQARAFLVETRRILRPGGIVRLAAPDLARQVEDYLATSDADAFIAGTHMSQGRPGGLVSRFRMALVGPRNHLWMYDGSSLARLVHDTGFVNARVMPAGVTAIAEPGSLDLAERAEQSVYVEARRSEDA
ncbi:MAG TPA: hypothetical protein DHU96_22640 [Actinobacteria bacterium]|nr:hypothetical protein [Actinomycetota bacterium]